MKIAALMLAGAAAIAVTTAAFAEQALTGTITRINRIDGTVAIRQTGDATAGAGSSQNGTVGTGTGAAAEQFKVQDAASLKAVHAGDRVSYSVTDNGGTKTITKIEKR